jgi:hypothetical protein
MTDLVLQHGLSFADPYDRDGLVRIDQAFVAHFAETDVALHDRLMTARQDPDAVTNQSESDLLVGLAPHFEGFVGDLFGITDEVRTLQTRHHEFAPLYSVRRLFVQRRAVKGVKEVDAEELDGPGLARELDRLMGVRPDEASMIPARGRRFAEPVANWLTDEAANEEPLATAQGRTDLIGALDQANYCIWCHNQGKDSCAKGLREKDGSFKKTVFGVTLADCPLEEKISEMNLVKARGNAIGALAIISVDNPLCAATGHRIRNDCLKACIYQRQDPQIETRTLKDVLGLPWGFKVYVAPPTFQKPKKQAATGIFRALPV